MTVKLSFLTFGPGDALRMLGEAGRVLLPECVLLSWAVIESFLGVLGVVGRDFEGALFVLERLGVTEPLPPR